MRLTVWLLVTSLVATSATARLKPELRTGSMIPTKPQKVAAKDAGLIRKGFGRCVFRKARPKALALLQHADMVIVDLPSAGITKVNSDLASRRAPLGRAQAQRRSGSCPRGMEQFACPS